MTDAPTPKRRGRPPKRPPELAVLPPPGRPAPEPEKMRLSDLDEEAMLVHLLDQYQHSLMVGTPGSVAYTQCLTACQKTHAELVILRKRKAADADATRTDEEVVEAFRADWRMLPPSMRDRLLQVIEEEG